VYFFFAGSFPSLDGMLGPFAAERFGFNMAWLAAIYLTFQLISIPRRERRMPAHARRNMSATCTADHSPPRAVLILRAVSARATPRSDSTPLALIC